MADAYRYVIANNGEQITAPAAWDGTGISDTIKGSDKHGVIIANQIFNGTPSENDIDLVRGSNLVIGPNIHQSKPGVANHTIKGGFDRVHFNGDFGTAELGQYSIYDKWFALPPTRNVTFALNARGTCTIWRCEMPSFVPSGVRIKRMHPAIVWAYFVFRSIQQTIIGK